MLNWQYYPKSSAITETMESVVNSFEKNLVNIQSPENQLASNQVMEILRPSLEQIGFIVEKSKRDVDKIKVPVLFGKNGNLEKYFEADAFHKEDGIVLEIEAGRGVTNYQFLKDLFQACMMYNVKYLSIAVRNDYRGNNDFEKVISFFDALYASNRLTLPLEGILILGY